MKELNKNLIENPTDILIDLGYDANIDKRYLESKYRNLVADDIIFYATGDLDYDWLQVILDTVLASFSYKYKKLKQTIDYKYDYEKNYNRIRKETITDSMGERITTADTGQTKITSEQGASKNTATHSEMSYDVSPTGDFVKNAQDVTDSDAVTDVSTTDARQDKSTLSGYEDKHVTEEEEYGDLSVRTPADMIAGERKIAYFSIWDEIYKDIMKEISLDYFAFD